MMGKIKDKIYTFYHDKKTERLKKFPPKVQDNRILFETENDFDGNARLLYDYMINAGYNRKYELIWLVKNPEKYKAYAKDNVKFVRKFRKDCEERRAECYEYMLSSKYIFYNESVNWIAQTQKRQIFVNLWEGCGYKIGSRRHKIFFDHCLIRSEAFTESNKKYFGCTSKKMLPLGYPCLDLVLKGSPEAKKYAKKLLKAAGSKKLVLWMPEARRKKGEQAEHIFNLPIIREEKELRGLDALCRESGILLLVYNNYLRMPDGETLTNIVGFKDKDLTKNKVDLYGLLHYADAFIGDYTKESIDYLLLDRPVAYLLESLGTPGAKMAWSVENLLSCMPGKHLYQMEDIEAFLRETADGKDDFREARAAVVTKLHQPCDNYCKRILEHFGINLS